MRPFNLRWIPLLILIPLKVIIFLVLFKMSRPVGERGLLGRVGGEGGSVGQGNEGILLGPSFMDQPTPIAQLKVGKYNIAGVVSDYVPPARTKGSGKSSTPLQGAVG